MPSEENSNPDDLTLLRRARDEGPDVIERLLATHRDRLVDLVRRRIDRRLHRRLDASDVIQETFLEANRRLDEYLANPRIPFGLWLKLLAEQKVTQMHRHHLGVLARDVRRERSMNEAASPASSAYLAAQIAGKLTSPSNHMTRAELTLQIRSVLEEMPERDRDIVSLRHFEQLSLREAAEALGITHAAACNRYVRAIKRLRDQLGDDVIFDE